jgi:uncharacterized protein
MSGPSGPSSLSELYEAARAAAASRRGLPPVHLWNPPHCGEIDIRIRPDGTWLHEGTPIGRASLVRLFSTVLRKDADGVYLVTPAEKLRITVDDAPFVAVGMVREGGALRFVTNVGDEVEAGLEHPIRVETAGNGEPRPYLMVRAGLEALIARAVFYDLVELGEPRPGPDGRRLEVSSNGCRFDLGPLDV